MTEKQAGAGGVMISRQPPVESHDRLPSLATRRWPNSSLASGGVEKANTDLKGVVMEPSGQ